MRKLFVSALICFFVILNAQENKGTVTLVDGKVKKKLINEADWSVDVSENGSVQSQESYKTEKKSRAELELAGMDIIRLAPKTSIDIVALYEEALNGKKQSNVKLNDGEIWAQVNSSGEDSEFKMNTDVSAAAITGTNFRMSNDGELTQMKVYHGEVKITNSQENIEDMIPVPVDKFETKEISGPKEIAGPQEVTLNEWIYIVKNMQQITFDKSGKVVSAGDFSSKDKAENNDWVRWNKIRDRKKGLK